ncbi:MAG TPA: two-component regulator propeller domain-containing protein [Ignavibacteriaceae bacterium]|nr:two-component regulator propeller domain-containing protein [Ignavibacteriaceae bacterium]
MKIRHLIFILPLFFIYTAQAQNHIAFNHLTVEEGLSQSAVNCIFQDEKGFMWFGTQDGLNRYDGYNIKIFKNDPDDSTSLINNFIFSIFEDTSGILYIENQGGGFQKYNPLTESFIRMSKSKLDLSHTRFSTNGAFLVDASGIEWMGGQASPDGLKKINTKTGKIIVYKHDPLDPGSLSDNKVYSIYRDKPGNLWVGTAGGLDKLNEKTGKFIHYRHDPGNPESLSDNNVWPIYEDSRGYLWVGTANGGLNRFDPGEGTFISYKNDPADPTSINDNYILSVYEDRSGMMWIGTNAGGVNYYNPSSQIFNHFANDPSDKNSLSNNFILSMCVDKNPDVYWIGTRGGLSRFDFKRKQFKNYTYDPSIKNGISSNSIQTLFEDLSGNLWIGNLRNGLDMLNPVTSAFKHYESIPSDTNSLSDNRIYALAQDKQGSLWIGTYQGGLNKLDPVSGKVICYRHHDNDPNSISSDRVWSVAVDKTGKLWLGTFGGGVNVFDPASGTAVHLKNNPDDPTSLIDNNVIRVFIDKDNIVWVGTTKGLSRYDSGIKKFKNFREKDGLPNEFIFGILQDKSGDLWLSTNNGLSRFDPKTEIFTNYFYQDGLQGNEFNQSAFAKDYKTGRLLFGGNNGFNIFNPENIKGNTYIPPIVFTDYVRYNTDDEEGKPIFEKGISERDSLFLTYKDNIINLQFSALSYNNNSDNRYKYMLKGFNKNWIQLGNEHTITFTNLSPGKYNLKVIGSNNDGIWNNEGSELFIEVTPPWWRTKTAYGIYVVIFIGVLYGARRIELNRREQKAQIRENELRLKATVAEKRAIEAENERKTKELEEARQMQLSMLPKTLPQLPNLEIAAFMRTATEVGGDYYDLIKQDGGPLHIGFGDATGHGLQAGIMVTLMKGFFTSDAARLELKDFMSHCTAMIKEIKLGRILMSFSLLKIMDHKLSITSGGMPPVYFYRKETQDVEEILIQGMPLGAMKKFPYQVVEKDLMPGDTLLLLSDGFPEQMNQNEEMFDYPRVKAKFKEIAECPPDSIIESLVKSADEWMGERIQADDITFIVLKIK